MTNALEKAWLADEHDYVAEAIRSMFTRDLLKARLQRMDEAGLPDYFRPTKEMKSPKRPFSLLKALRYLLP